MEEDREDIRDVIFEELKRLGVQEVTRKKSHGSQGSRLLGINTSSNITGKSNNHFRSKNKNKRSPRLAHSRSPNSKLNPNQAKDERKHKSTPKSPFSSSKRKAEQRKQNAKDKVGVTASGQVFSQKLENVPSVCVYMADGTQVTVAEFLVDICNLIRRSITVEGIFRKAGSSQRQTDLKKLIDNSNSLPSNVHVIDGACLMKQFLRCLPEPLLPSEVHSKIVKCMDLADELRIEAITLCTLLLPETHRYTLIYLMDFLAEVVAASGSNLMDAHNLAIVLAPNLLPTTITPTTSRKYFQSLPSEDALLTTNIEILQLMIENGSRLGRMPTNLALALEHRERSKSTENLLTSQPHPSARKKRRSASIHRLMTGLRRVVGHSTGSGSPLRASDSTEYLDTLHQHPGVALSPSPMFSVTPRKRKSADAFDFCSGTPGDAASDAHQISPSPSSKRVRVESEVGVATNVDATTPVFSGCLPITIVTCATPNTKQSTKVGQPVTVREGKDAQDVLAQSAQRTSLKGNTRSNLKESLSSKIRAFSQSPSFNVHAVHGGVNRRSIDRIEPLGQPKQDKAYPRAYSQLCFETSPVKKPSVKKRRSCDVPLNGGAKRAGNFDNHVRVVRRNSFDWRSSGNEPDGADNSTLGPRGIPDGAECNLRDGILPKPRVSNSLETLEQHYDDIKSVVKTMEAEVDKSNVQQMKETYFPDKSPSSQNMSCSEMIQDAYERMREEAKDLGISPSQNLSKRLNKELKIRKRRSDEHRVMRSPSERKIGTIRRRSRELVQNAAKSGITVEDAPIIIQPQQTPKMKEHLMQTPVNGSLRRGKPNSVKSGLPFVVRSFSPLQKENSATKSTNRMVIVSKRVDENNVFQPTKASGRSPYQGSSSRESSRSFESELQGSIGDLPSLSLDVSNQSADDNLMDSILELLPGAMTRRRSSLLSSMTSSFPILKLSSSESLNSDVMCVDSGGQRNSTDMSSDAMEVNEMEKQDFFNESLGNSSSVLALPARIFPDRGEMMEDWIPAVEFDYADDDQRPMVCEGGQGRPSLAALIKQKKVTANVQLFNNLHTVTPSRRSKSRLRSTPKPNIPPHSTASERRIVRLSYSKSFNSRCTLTPRELLKARQKSFQFDRSPINLAKIAVVSPLKESTWINIQQEHAQEVSKAFKGEATIPLAPTFTEKRFKPPLAPQTPIRSQGQLKIFGIHREGPSASPPPKLPPRSIVRPSPIRIQYR